MELKEHLKEHRQRLGLAQEDLSERIFVTRQTISNWETDKTYPDVQSLLLLRDLFGVSIDELVKGDVAAMESETKKEWRRMSRFIAAAWGLIALGVLYAVAGSSRTRGRRRSSLDGARARRPDASRSSSSG